MRFDVIRAVEACYAGTLDDRAWLDGVLQTLEPLDQGPGFAAFLMDASRTHDVTRDWSPGAIVLSATSGGSHSSNTMLEMNEDLGLFRMSVPPDVLRRFEAPSPPIERALKRAARVGPRFVEFWRGLLSRHGLKDCVGIFACEPRGGTLLITTAIPTGRPLLSARTFHQLTLFSAHLTSSMRLRAALSGAASDTAGHAPTEAVLDPAGRVLDAMKGAQAKDARQGLADAVRRMDRARGPMRRTDPDDALQLWQGLVDGTWSLVDQCDSDGKRYILARRNEPGVRDPRALSQRERSVVAFASMGHQNKFIGYLLGSPPARLPGTCSRRNASSGSLRGPSSSGA